MEDVAGSDDRSNAAATEAPGTPVEVTRFAASAGSEETWLKQMPGPKVTIHTDRDGPCRGGGARTKKKKVGTGYGDTLQGAEGGVGEGGRMPSRRQ